ncbi:MAG: amidohydrolase family protein [Verrucomicrobiaceae bacterium]|nr:amidohydrolase family protein [Verrucomicrobiaceae bacterium]
MIIDCHNHVGADLLFYLHGDFPYAQHLVAMHDEGLALGVSRWMVFPFVSHLALDVSAFRDGEIKDAAGRLHDVPYAFENLRLLKEIYELFPDEGRRMLPLIMADPMRNTAAQAVELRKLRARYHFYGIKMQTTILQADIKHLRDRGKVFLELAEEWDLPFLIHSSVAESDLWAQARDILDVAEENPQVRFCLAHSCRFDKECLDRVNALPNTWFDNSAHCIHCLGVVKDMPFVAPKSRRFDTDYTNPARVIADLAAAYPRKFMWGSDSPFYSYAAEINGQVVRLISTYKAEVDALTAAGDEVVKRIAFQNTVDYLKLKDESILS